MRVIRKIGFAICLLGILFLTNCDDIPVVEIPETTEQTENSLDIASNVISTYDFIEDFASTNRILGLNEKIILPSSVNLVYRDILFLDGDGIEVEVDFGEHGTSEPYGVLCLDGVYRAGKIVLKLNKPYEEIGSILTAAISSADPLYSGDGSTMVSFEGDIVLERFTKELIQVTTQNLSGLVNRTPFDVNFNIQADKKEDGGTGIVNDVIHYSGVMQVKDASQILSVTVKDALLKSYSADCMDNIVEGVLDIKSDRSLSEISVDFDPDKTGECDRLVEITFNGKAIQYHY